MKPIKKLLLITLLTTATLFAGFQTVDCSNQAHLDTLKLPQVECEILDAFWDAMGDGAGWTDKTGWDTVTYAGSWSGVYMHDDNSSINALGWTNGNGITGELPSVLGELISPTQLAFSNNNLKGTIPLSIKNLTQLTGFSLNYNNLSGDLPDFRQMPNLRYVQIHDNNFTFSNIEPQVNLLKDLYSFACSPQAPIDESAHEVVYFNENIPLVIEPSLAPNPSGNDKYTWSFAPNTTDLPTELDYNLSRIYTKLQPTTTDEGYYNYRVDNINFSNARRAEQRLHLYSTRNDKAIRAVYNHTPQVTSTQPPAAVTVGEPYSYTATIFDADSDELNVTAGTLPSWLSLSAGASGFTLEGTPDIGAEGDYDINITVTDGKIPVHINYILHVNPSADSLPGGFSVVAGVYSHNVTHSSIAGAANLEIINNGGIELAEICNGTVAAFASLNDAGVLTTGYEECTSHTRTQTLATPYPNDAHAEILTESIRVEFPLTQDVTIGGN